MYLKSLQNNLSPGQIPSHWYNVCFTFHHGCAVPDIVLLRV